MLNLCSLAKCVIGIIFILELFAIMLFKKTFSSKTIFQKHYKQQEYFADILNF